MPRLDKFQPGQRLSARDMNEIVRRVVNAVTGGRNTNVTRSSQQMVVENSGHQIIPTNKGGASILNAANKAALDLMVVSAPRQGWTEDTELMYERSEDGLTWVISNRWREFTP